MQTIGFEQFYHRANLFFCSFSTSNLLDQRNHFRSCELAIHVAHLTTSLRYHVHQPTASDIFSASDGRGNHSFSTAPCTWGSVSDNVRHWPKADLKHVRCDVC